MTRPVQVSAMSPADQALAEQAFARARAAGDLGPVNRREPAGRYGCQHPSAGWVTEPDGTTWCPKCGGP